MCHPIWHGRTATLLGSISSTNVLRQHEAQSHVPWLIWAPAGQFRNHRRTNLCVLCILCVVVLFPVGEGPCKRYAMARYVCQARGSRQSVYLEGDHMNKMRGSTGHQWMAVQVEPTLLWCVPCVLCAQSELPAWWYLALILHVTHWMISKFVSSGPSAPLQPCGEANQAWIQRKTVFPPFSSFSDKHCRFRWDQMRSTYEATSWWGWLCCPGSA